MNQQVVQIHWWMRSVCFLLCSTLYLLQEGLLPDYNKLDSLYNKVWQCYITYSFSNSFWDQ